MTIRADGVPRSTQKSLVLESVNGWVATDPKNAAILPLRVQRPAQSPTSADPRKECEWVSVQCQENASSTICLAASVTTGPCPTTSLSKSHCRTRWMDSRAKALSRKVNRMSRATPGRSRPPSAIRAFRVGGPFGVDGFGSCPRAEGCGSQRGKRSPRSTSGCPEHDLVEVACPEIPDVVAQDPGQWQVALLQRDRCDRARSQLGLREELVPSVESPEVPGVGDTR